jgi:outer membrane protein OmpA-like peptidoglycan-associated protein
MTVKLARLAALPIGLAATLGATSALAQGTTGTNVQNNIALDQFDPSPAGDQFFGLPSAYARGRIEPRAYVALDYADQPLRLQSSNTSSTGAIVGSQMFLHVAGSLTLFDRAVVSVSLPIAVLQSGQSLDVGGTSVAAPTSASLGDLRIGARVRIVGDDEGPAQLAAGGYVYVPTGALDGNGSYTGDGSARVAPHLLFGGKYRLLPSLTLAYTSLGGFSIKSSKNPTSVVYGVGVAALLMKETLQIGPEFYASTPIQPGNFSLGTDEKVALTNTTNAELLFGARWRFWEGLSVGAAGGPGLSKAIGTPAFRVTGVIAWAPVPEPTSAEENQGDADHDGIPDATDACPYAAGVANADPKKQGCPIVDDDDDGIPNDQDACPNEYAKPTDTSDRKGCPPPPPPPDTDGDTIPDTKDACPKEAGPISQDPAKNGCPPPPPNPDTDGDGINDSDDACPNDRGVKSSDAKANGCKTLVRSSDKQIALFQSIDFRVAKKDLPPIEAASEPVLAQLKDLLTERPDILKIEIGAYTDNEGKEAFNVKTSQSRADSVKKWLVDHGVAEGRLVAKGYGPKNPIADNKTKEGRAKNKRIEITILEKK